MVFRLDDDGWQWRLDGIVNTTIPEADSWSCRMALVPVYVYAIVWLMAYILAGLVLFVV